jgi:hypothetical protein
MEMEQAASKMFPQSSQVFHSSVFQVDVSALARYNLEG